MTRRIVVIGAGVGGLSAALRLAQQGCHVTVLEARGSAGGLASGIEIDGFQFDAGPYVLLDRPGLEWAFQQLQICLTDHFQLTRIPELLQVHSQHQPPVRIFDSVDRTAAELESQWPGSGDRYRQFIQHTRQIYQRLQPMQWKSEPGLADLWRGGSWRDIPFLLRSLKQVLSSTGLPTPVQQALGIWTHVAGQSAAQAPSPLALVPAVVHQLGACYPDGGIASIPATLYQTAVAAGVEFRFHSPVQQICCQNRRAVGVRVDGQMLDADAVLSDVGLATYLSLADSQGRQAIPGRVLRKLQQLPLQSPGVCVYLAVKGQPEPPYLRFRLFDQPDGCRLLVNPGLLDPALQHDGWYPARLIAPMAHQRAAAEGAAGQRRFLQQILEQEAWWRDCFADVRVLRTRIPADWGSQFYLYQHSMNPVMTSRFMLTGRIAHRSPWIRNLYLAGSSTHPGQWVSFCAVSGILAADRLLQDQPH